ncbi:Predicted arabinose efflux permease, MFS family [Sanguibacter gelidistatuariae]|uniref:Predicted arabinose efflux permease, MFS family n=1 Tax=Sanguibacter gelidistatuariae TaxID=1814289 RepID=A0A1G6UM31_9MICO|nr:MFS transporter [Sanguibacter gelidistatuariae]SDD42373.1 Predicted arabinose efflux permease, MFS family [Sanguibacter gelidistatuariae]
MPNSLDHPPVRSILRNHNYRLFLIAQFFGGTGMWMLRLSQDWLVLKLTGSPAAVGIIVALQFVPLLTFGPLGGVIADRHNKRHLVMAAQSAAAVLAATLAALTIGGLVTVPLLYLFALASGCVAVFDQPARQVLVNELVGDGQLRSAISTNNALNQLSGLVGPALAGVLINQVGQGWAFAANATLCLVVVALVASMRVDQLHPVPTITRSPGQLKEGFRYIMDRPRLMWVVILAGFMGAFGMNGPVVLAAFADFEWETGSSGFGLYNSIGAVGGLIGAITAARMTSLRVRTVVVGAAVFSGVEIVAALSPTHWAFLVMLAAVGAATMFFLTSAGTYVQLTASPRVRGRVMAFYMPLLLGGHAAGGLLQGWFTEHLGVRGGLVLTGGLGLLATCGVGLALLRLRGRQAEQIEPVGEVGEREREEPVQ